jgi:hypothetical protein
LSECCKKGLYLSNCSVFSTIAGTWFPLIPTVFFFCFENS